MKKPRIKAEKAEATLVEDTEGRKYIIHKADMYERRGEKLDKHEKMT